MGKLIVTTQAIIAGSSSLIYFLAKGFIKLNRHSHFIIVQHWLQTTAASGTIHCLALAQ